MAHHAPRRRRWFLPAALTLAVALPGCAGVRLHDASRAKVAGGVKESYAKASALSAIEVEKKNLDNLLEEELKVVRDNQRLRVDFALLRIADDGTPMADTYTTRATQRVKALGYESFKDARASLVARAVADVRAAELARHAARIKGFGGVAPPDCAAGTVLPPALELPATVAPAARAAAENFYRLYRRACELWQQSQAPAAGLIADALGEWQAAVAEVAALDRTVDDARKEVAARSAAHDKAKTAASGAGASKELQEKAAAAAKALDEARSVLDLIDAKGTAGQRVDALVQILTAAAGGKVDPKDPQVAKAAGVAGQIPSLQDELADLVNRGRAPSVSNLLIELRHQVVLLDRARQLRAFAQQRADLARAQYDALRNEAELWLRFADAVCSYAVVAGDPKQWPGPRCDDFSIKAGPPVTCDLGGAPIPDCPLSRRWNEAIRKPVNEIATRELYKALAVYLQALASQGTQLELAFRMIDVRHREALTTREAALRGWDNLVAVPIDQLDAYYQAGLKPAEIADLLVKALGFAAIAVGVSQ